MNFTTLATKLAQDDAGFIVSAELVLVSTIIVLGMIVGLAEIGYAVNQELEDVASAFGSVNQSFQYRAAHGGRACATGSAYYDSVDECDDDCDVQFASPRSEK